MHKIKVLVIEDNDDNWLAIKTSLRKHANCTLAETINGGLELFGRETYDLVLLDLQLPDRPGLEFALEVRKGQRFPKIPIVAVSASVLSVDSKTAIDAGCNGFISKPFTRQELLDQLAKYLPQGSPAG